VARRAGLVAVPVALPALPVGSPLPAALPVPPVTPLELPPVKAEALPSLEAPCNVGRDIAARQLYMCGNHG
jgi:hypothetical protein